MKIIWKPGLNFVSSPYVLENTPQETGNGQQQRQDTSVPPGPTSEVNIYEQKKKLTWECRLSDCFRILKEKMKTIEVTQEEIYQATRPNIYRNRKKYTRKDKHRNKFIED